MPSKQNNVTQTSKHAHMNIDIYKLFKKQQNKTHKLYVHNKKKKKNQQGPFSEYKQKANVFGKAAKLHMAC